MNDQNQGSSNPPRILFVEDEILLAMTYSETLREMNLGEVVQAGSLDEANAALDAGPVSIAILDVNVAKDTSFDVARRVEASGGKVVFATGYAVDPEDFDGIDCEILRKPYDEEELRAVVRRAHETR